MSWTASVARNRPIPGRPTSVSPRVATSDEALLAGLGAGDRDAQVAFVRRFQGRVYGLALTIVGDPRAAEDVAQETFLRAWRHAASYDARRGRVATWILAIARNLAIDVIRVRRPQPIDPQTLASLSEAGAADPSHEDRDRIRTALGALPAEQRRALVLATYFGRTAREIGELDGVPLGTVKTRIRSGMMKLREELEVAGGR